MVQEYLFIGNDNLKDEADLCICDIKPEIEEIKNSDCKIVKYITEGNDEKSAKVLSALNEKIIKKYSPTILTNESAAYFNKRLYPLFNEFERKLRKLLYLKSALSEKAMEEAEIIKDLENKDFGEIFSCLFSDAKFVKRVRQSVNDKTWQFTKAEILTALQQIPEDTVWDDLIGEDAVLLLRSRFIEVKDFRNDVMHAHNMNAESFYAAEKLIKGINEQLDKEIGTIIGEKGTAVYPIESKDFNKTLSLAFQEGIQEISKIPLDALPSLVEFQKIAALIEQYKISLSTEIFELQETLQAVVSASKLYKKEK